MNKSSDKNVSCFKKYGLSNDEERICTRLVLGKKKETSADTNYENKQSKVEIEKSANKNKATASETNITKHNVAGVCSKSASDIDRSKYISEMGGILLKQGDHTIQDNILTKKITTIHMKQTNQPNDQEKSKCRISLFEKTTKIESKEDNIKNSSFLGKTTFSTKMHSGLFDTIELTPKIKKHQYTSRNPSKLSHMGEYMKNIFFENEIHFSEEMILKEITLTTLSNSKIIKPKKRKRYRIKQEPLNRPLLLKFSTLDASMMKCRSFKVGWSKGFSFTMVKNKILHLAKITSISSNLDEFMEVVLGETEFISQKVTKDVVPYCRITMGENILNQFNEFEYYEDVWKLVMALWGGTGDYNVRRKLFNDWLEIVCNDLIAVALISIRNEGFYNQILTYLSGHQIYKAAQHSFDAGAPQLALLISNINVKTNQELLNEQINDWKETEVIDTIPTDISKTYSLLTGNANNYHIDWLRNLAMHFWYTTSTKEPLQHAINNFEQKYGYPKRQILYKIMKLYCNSVVNLGALLNPSRHCNEPTDYQLTWLLMQLLTSLQQINVDTNLLNHISTKFATQLEDIGKPRWALFVTLFIPDLMVRKNTLMGILIRNNCDIKNLQIPPAWIHIIEANKYEQLENYFVASYHYAHSKCWQKCHELITIYILPTLIANHEYGIAAEFLNIIKDHKKFIYNWKIQAGFILDFIYLYESIELKFENPMRLYGELCSFTKRIKDYPTNTPGQCLVISEISKFTTEYFHMVLQEVAVNKENYLLNSIRMFKQTVMPPDYKYLHFLNSFMYYFQS